MNLIKVGRLDEMSRDSTIPMLNQPQQSMMDIIDSELNSRSHMYKSLFPRYKEQPSNEVFARFIFREKHWDEPFRDLAELAKDEDWNFRNSKTKGGSKFPILRSYLNYTFIRLQDERKIVLSKCENWACFNTGLQTDNDHDIYAIFKRNKSVEEKKGMNWNFQGYSDDYDGGKELTRFRQPELPPIATYITDARDLVFDTNCKIVVNYKHLLEDNRDRLPDILKKMPDLTIRAIIEGQKTQLEGKVLRNYKLAIPHWYRNRIQLLLPLQVESKSGADLALVAEKDPHAPLYRIRTVLTIDMAYNNARLIARPDRDWLNP